MFPQVKWQKKGTPVKKVPIQTLIPKSIISYYLSLFTTVTQKLFFSTVTQKLFFNCYTNTLLFSTVTQKHANNQVHYLYKLQMDISDLVDKSLFADSEEGVQL